MWFTQSVYICTPWVKKSGTKLLSTFYQILTDFKKFAATSLLQSAPNHQHVTYSVKTKFHYADFPVTSATSPRQTRDVSFSPNPRTGNFRESRVCRGRHGEVGIVEFGLNAARRHATAPLSATRRYPPPPPPSSARPLATDSEVNRPLRPPQTKQSPD